MQHNRIRPKSAEEDKNLRYSRWGGRKVVQSVFDEEINGADSELLFVDDVLEMKGASDECDYKIFCR